MQVVLNINNEADWLALLPLLSRLQISYTAHTETMNYMEEQTYQYNIAQHGLAAAYGNNEPDYSLSDMQQINPNYIAPWKKVVLY